MNKSMKVKRARFDGAYMFAAVFAAVGGLLLLGSYASSKPIETYNQGNYNLAKYATNQPDIFLLGLNSKYNYCFDQIENTQSTVISIENDKESYVPVNLNISQDKTVCFKPIANYDKAEVKIVPVPESTVNIRVL